MFIKLTIQLAVYLKKDEVIYLNTENIKYVKKSVSGATVVMTVHDNDLIVQESLDEIWAQLEAVRK